MQSGTFFIKFALKRDKTFNFVAYFGKFVGLKLSTSSTLKQLKNVSLLIRAVNSSGFDNVI